ncbi:hypothetical protein DFA_10450 [Cavenderia fasciculata]|uniref:Transmembrane protein n=1 Tax=Cavenderia fasciculata TaxID=261658 RepID=F4QA89_CACFS|nr:uncharacterized protein DFA_10450 [Cavenderia fasciculata]EGG15608.1 hypothetical protein DFA_10450 [Cavenderia fasciculata]|eukprot:XP_004354350.1 hypothetical protein DFA_10450 [Cavenderia fasciculata]
MQDNRYQKAINLLGTVVMVLGAFEVLSYLVPILLPLYSISIKQSIYQNLLSNNQNQTNISNNNNNNNFNSTTFTFTPLLPVSSELNYTNLINSLNYTPNNASTGNNNTITTNSTSTNILNSTTVYHQDPIYSQHLKIYYTSVICSEEYQQKYNESTVKVNGKSLPMIKYLPSINLLRIVMLVTFSVGGLLAAIKFCCLSIETKRDRDSSAKENLLFYRLSLVNSVLVFLLFSTSTMLAVMFIPALQKDLSKYPLCFNHHEGGSGVGHFINFCKHINGVNRHYPGVQLIKWGLSATVYYQIGVTLLQLINITRLYLKIEMTKIQISMELSDNDDQEKGKGKGSKDKDKDSKVWKKDQEKKTIVHQSESESDSEEDDDDEEYINYNNHNNDNINNSLSVIDHFSNSNSNSPLRSSLECMLPPPPGSSILNHSSMSNIGMIGSSMNGIGGMTPLPISSLSASCSCIGSPSSTSLTNSPRVTAKTMHMTHIRRNSNNSLYSQNLINQIDIGSSPLPPLSPSPTPPSLSKSSHHVRRHSNNNSLYSQNLITTSTNSLLPTPTTITTTTTTTALPTPTPLSKSKSQHIRRHSNNHNHSLISHMSNTNNTLPLTPSPLSSPSPTTSTPKSKSNHIRRHSNTNQNTNNSYSFYTHGPLSLSLSPDPFSAQKRWSQQ